MKMIILLSVLSFSCVRQGVVKEPNQRLLASHQVMTSSVLSCQPEQVTVTNLQFNPLDAHFHYSQWNAKCENDDSVYFCLSSDFNSKTRSISCHEVK